MLRLALKTFLNQFAALALCILAAPVAFAGSPSIEFNRDVRPILSDKCFACHGFDKNHRKADLRLDTAAGAAAEHKGRRAVTPGDLGKSELWKRVNAEDADERMPPADSHKTLSAAEKEILKRWIEGGAAYQLHWSFEPIRKPPVPTPAVTGKNPIDAFLFARLESEGLKPHEEADRPTLIRRAAFALTGLPPTPSEVTTFLSDKSPGAYERMVDRYMASPRFGEEMARHWLDIARYGDTHGLHLDNERQMWAYRDYVVNSFNANKPFDAFTVEQLAGDQLPEAAHPKPTQEQLTATGFNRCNVTSSEGGSIDAEYLFRYAVDRTATTMQAWLGLTGGCAVCHDHKFDPISAREFYSMYAFFYSAADPAMDGNALLTNPVAKLPTPRQEKQLAELKSRLLAKQKDLEAAADALAYVDLAEANPRPRAEERETIWFDDDVPANLKASPGAPTAWALASEGADVYSGERALKRTDAGLAQDVVEGSVELHIPPEGRIFAYVRLDPKNLPKTIMLQFHTGEWKHRAVWGDYDAIEWGAPNTTEKVNLGALPEAGRWTRLEFPAEKVGLRPGDRVSGFAFTQFGGTVMWDKLGVVGRTDGAADPGRSLLAWRKERAGKDTPNTPGEINAILKAGLDKPLEADAARKLRNHWLLTMSIGAKPKLAPIADEIASIRSERDKLETMIPSTFVFTDLGKPRDAFVMLRGQYDKPGEKVEPATPAFLPTLHKANADGRATRLDLARWIVSSDNPLTARVTVNRFWQQFFGTGLVKSSGDFGAQGDPPTHPELLDWLAANFREEGWDVKALVRLMVTSAAFRQESIVTPDLVAKDPENRLYARAPRLRLDAEQIRDNALFVSGLMNLEMGGKGVNPYQPPNIWEPVGFVGSNTQYYKQDTGDKLYRRSLYTFLKRTAPPPFMANFDAPSREQFCPRRERSDTPLQALQLMNDVQQFEAARALAQRMMTEGGATSADRIAFAFRAALSRAPEADETNVLKEQFDAHKKRYQADEAAAVKVISHGESKPKADLPQAELAAYTLVASTILNLDETLNRN